MEKQIPILDAQGLDKLHFGMIEWKLPNPNTHHFFHINKIEDITSKLHFPLPPHRKALYDLIFLTKGKSTRTKGLNQYEFGTNEFFFLPAFQITTHEWMSEDAEGYFIHFDARIFKENDLEHHLKKFPFLDYQSNPLIKVTSKSISPILNIFQRLEEIYLNEELKDFSLVVCYLLTLFQEANFHIDSEIIQPKTAAAVLSTKYKEALSQYIYTKQKVSEYADNLNVTPNHLNKCVKSVTGKSAQELLNEMLILEAKSLLKYSNLNIAEIAVKLFNQTPSNFSRFFKSQTGMTPKEYYT